MDNKEQLIRARAYHLWMQDACPPGRDLEYWLAAERELAAQDAAHEQIVESGDPPPPGKTAGEPIA